MMNIKNDVTSELRFRTSITSDVVIIDDDESMCEGCRQTLEEEGLKAVIARDGPQGLKMVKESHPKIVLVDLKMPGMTGQEVLAEISEIDPSIVSIIITGFGSIDTAVETMKIGAFDFLTKPFEPEKLMDSVKRGMELHNLHEKKEEVEKAPLLPEISKPDILNKKDIILEVLERASSDEQFIGQLIEQGSKNLEDYDLSSEEKAAIISGDIRWIENHVGKLTEIQKTWLNCRLQQERW